MMMNYLSRGRATQSFKYLPKMCRYPIIKSFSGYRFLIERYPKNYFGEAAFGRTRYEA